MVRAKVKNIIESDPLLTGRDLIEFPYVTELHLFEKRSGTSPCFAVLPPICSGDNARHKSGGEWLDVGEPYTEDDFGQLVVAIEATPASLSAASPSLRRPSRRCRWSMEFPSSVEGDQLKSLFNSALRASFPARLAAAVVSK